MAACMAPNNATPSRPVTAPAIRNAVSLPDGRWVLIIVMAPSSDRPNVELTRRGDHEQRQSQSTSEMEALRSDDLSGAAANFIAALLCTSRANISFFAETAR